MTLILVFKEVASDDETKYSTLYSYSKTETVVNQSDIDDLFESIYSTVISNIQNSEGKDSARIFDSVVDDTIKFVKVQVRKQWH